MKKDIYVDDLTTGGETETEVDTDKSTIILIFKSSKFNLHKWHSNIKALEEKPSKTTLVTSEETYVKEQLGVQENETKILGGNWNKSKDTLAVKISPPVGNMTKRMILQKLASICDPLGFISATTVIGKVIYRDTCEPNVVWDVEIQEWIKTK